MTVTPGRFLILVAVVLFAVAGLGATIGSLTELDLACIAGAFFAAGHLV